MKKYIIDTNVLLSFLTDRNAGQQKKAEPIFTQASGLKLELLLLETVLTEFVYVLESVYNLKPADIKVILDSLNVTPGIIFGAGFNLDDILKLWPHKVKDFSDAVIAVFALINNMPVITFDKKFQAQLDSLRIEIFKL